MKRAPRHWPAVTKNAISFGAYAVRLGTAAYVQPLEVHLGVTFPVVLMLLCPFGRIWFVMAWLALQL